jgi:tRNA U34 5-methylaminomethyl-2-thiouridine-forming methyltransferase MnmC
MQKIPTSDGSFTYYSEQFSENYHSLHGAKSESNLVYIEALRKLFEQTGKTEICVFEVGFGSGLNALLAFEFAKNNHISLFYFSVEKYPIEENILLSETDSALYQKIIKSKWNVKAEIDAGLFLLKIKTDIIDFEFDRNPDVIFYDAFSPETQPELWTRELFTKLFHSLNSPGILSTYSSKGTVKQALRSAGFIVNRLPGPQGKRHILYAYKNSAEV